MDLSPEYVKMCREAKEIQTPDRFYHEGDVYAFYVTGKWRTPEVYTYGMCLPYESGDYAVWIPRQDRLQEMLAIKVLSMIENFYQFTSFVFRYDACSDCGGGGLQEDATRTAEQFTSYEQLWLAYVMKEKFGKSWDGEGWK